MVGGDTVEMGQIPIEHDLLVADGVDSCPGTSGLQLCKQAAPGNILMERYIFIVS